MNIKLDTARGHLFALFGTLAMLATQISTNTQVFRSLLLGVGISPPTVAVVVSAVTIYLVVYRAFLQDPATPGQAQTPTVPPVDQHTNP